MVVSDDDPDPRQKNRASHKCPQGGDPGHTQQEASVLLCAWTDGWTIAERVKIGWDETSLARGRQDQKKKERMAHRRDRRKQRLQQVGQGEEERREMRGQQEKAHAPEQARANAENAHGPQPVQLLRRENKKRKFLLSAGGDTHTHTRTRTHTRTHTHKNTLTHKHTPRHTRARAHTHTHTRERTHAQLCSRTRGGEEEETTTKATS